MKRIHKSLYFIAAITAISFVSCQKQELESSTNGTRITINATVEPAMNTTKTHVVPEEGDIYNIEWDSNEHMRVIVYNSSTCNKLETTNFTLNDNGTGTFEAEIPSGEWTNISGIYPLSATDGTRSEDKQTDYRISLPQVQIPSRDSYDPKAFIMIARNTEVPEDLNNYVWNAYYYRATALNNFTIKNLEHADNIVNVKITFPEDELVAGYKRVDLTTCTVTGNRYQNSPNYIELKYTEPLSADASGNYELWFTTWEINVEPDETVKVEITTEDYKYTKDFTGHSASFKESFLNLLTLDMSNATVEKLETDDLSGEYLIAAYKDGSWAIMTPENKSGYYVAEVASSISTPIADISCEDFYPIPNVQDYVWTVTAMENGYSICNNESYISINDKDANAKSSATELSIVRNNDGTYLIEEPNSTFNRALLYNSTATRFKPYLKSEIETYPAPVLIPWVADTTPRISINNTEIICDRNASTGTIEYTISNADFSAVSVTVKKAEDSWISVSCENEAIRYTIQENTEESSRTATIVVSVVGGNTVEVEVIQSGKSTSGVQWSYTFESKEDTGLSGNIFGFQDGRGLQLTANKNAIYTKADYTGNIETITLVCSNNKSKGSGTATVTVGGTPLKYNGNTSATISGCSTTDTEFTFEADSPLSGELVVEIKATENSVYWKSITINKIQ